MSRSIPVLTYYNYLVIGDNLRFAGTILSAPAGMLYLGNENTLFQHVSNLIKLYTPNFFQKSHLEVRYKGQSFQCKVNYKGNFVLMIPIKNETEIHFDDIRLRLVTESSSSVVYRPDIYQEILHLKDYKYGVISDIDDTILQTGATTFFRRMKHIIFTRPEERQCIKDMPHVYRKLSRDKAKLFYVSNSEANLFPVITSFLISHNFPQGACFLRKNKLLSYFLKRSKVKRSATAHKIRTISFILRTQKDKKFVLIGDNGQWDPFIYKTIIKMFPDRINYVFLRDIHGKVEKKHREVVEGVSIIYFSTIADIKKFIDPRVRPEDGVQPELR